MLINANYADFYNLFEKLGYTYLLKTSRDILNTNTLLLDLRYYQHILSYSSSWFKLL